jgi:ABC-type antimicrobial peptide transport system permease subunit
MKLLSRTLLKSASVKLAALAVFFVLSATTALAQNPRIQTSQLDGLAAKASETVDVNIDESLMALTTKFLSSKDDDERKVKELVSGLKGIYVKSFEFENEGQYTEADLESIRSQLRNPAWSRIISARSKKEGSIEVYLMHSGGQISGLALLATELKEITVINIVGPVDLDKLTQLEGQFGIPELGLEGSKPKRKN